mmetsp:Transcript_4368/g.12676  ORF Transcript_4368/g.12676 Transcript_4368/m.12676 type:complete len:228 (-) Transcript_4368:1111-1794(-)
MPMVTAGDSSPTYPWYHQQEPWEESPRRTRHARDPHDRHEAEVLSASSWYSRERQWNTHSSAFSWSGTLAWALIRLSSWTPLSRRMCHQACPQSHSRRKSLAPVYTSFMRSHIGWFVGLTAQGSMRPTQTVRSAACCHEWSGSSGMCPGCSRATWTSSCSSMARTYKLWLQTHRRVIARRAPTSSAFSSGGSLHSTSSPCAQPPPWRNYCCRVRSHCPSGVSKRCSV